MTRKTHLLVILLLISAYLSVSCSTKPPTKTYEQIIGIAYFHFETSAFEPCENDEIWWLEIADNISEGFFRKIHITEQKIKRQSPIEIPKTASLFFYLEASGNITKKGSYGHLGKYDRNIYISQIYNLRVAQEQEITTCVTSNFLKYDPY